jgi:hypothetical protein
MTRFFVGLNKDHIIPHIITPNIHRPDTINPGNFLPIKDTIERYGDKCPSFDYENSISALPTNECRFKHILNSSLTPSSAFEKVRMTNPLMAVKYGNLKQKLHQFYPTVPEPNKVHLSSFTPKALQIRNDILVMNPSFSNRQFKVY